MKHYWRKKMTETIGLTLIEIMIGLMITVLMVGAASTFALMAQKKLVDLQKKVSFIDDTALVKNVLSNQVQCERNLSGKIISKDPEVPTAIDKLSVYDDDGNAISDLAVATTDINVANGFSAINLTYSHPISAKYHVYEIMLIREINNAKKTERAELTLVAEELGTGEIEFCRVLSSLGNAPSPRDICSSLGLVYQSEANTCVNPPAEWHYGDHTGAKCKDGYMKNPFAFWPYSYDEPAGFVNPLPVPVTSTFADGSAQEVYPPNVAICGPDNTTESPDDMRCDYDIRVDPALVQQFVAKIECILKK